MAHHNFRNQFYMHLVGDNLIRRLTAVATFTDGAEPWTVSFKGALQTLNNFLPVLGTSVSTSEWCEALLAAIATHTVGNRPDRFEPRVRKRRPKTYKLMRQPREQYKNRIAA